MAQFPVPAFIPVAFDANGDELDYTTLADATGAQLANAMAREKQTWRRHSLSEIWRCFRTAGGRAEDRSVRYWICKAEPVGNEPATATAADGEYVDDCSGIH